MSASSGRWAVGLLLALTALLAGCAARPGPPTATGAPAPLEPRLEVFARGLLKPRGLAFGPDGSLYVAEAGNGGPNLIDVGVRRPHTYGRTGRLTRFTPDGQRTVLADNLPSIFTAYDEEAGPSGLAFLGKDLYLLTASGGWEIGDPAFHSGLFRLTADGHLQLVFDYSAWTRDHPARARLEDPRAGVPYGMPYGLAALNGRLYTTDGNHEQILEITPDGQATRIFEYPRSSRALTGLAAGPDGALYVAEYAGLRVTRLVPGGEATEFATKLQNPIAVAFDPDGQAYVLEYFHGRIGLLARRGGAPRYLVPETRQEATALVVGPDRELYLSSGGGGNADHAGSSPEGQILRLHLPPRPRG